MVAVGCNFMLARANRLIPAQTHQAADTALTNIKAGFVAALWALPAAELHCHARPSIT
jgi:hypothetical protein